MLRRRAASAAARREALSRDVLEYVDPLFATAMRLSRQRQDAEDLVQDTLVKALRFAERFEQGTNLKAWLYTILHNTWRNRVRDRAREGLQVDSGFVEQEASRPDGPSVFETPERILLRSTLGADLQQVGDLLFRLPMRFHMPVWSAVAVLLALIGGSVVILARRVRGVEVVA